MLNTVHEAERPKVTMPLPVSELVGDEQLREPAITLERAFRLNDDQGIGVSAPVCGEATTSSP